MTGIKKKLVRICLYTLAVSALVWSVPVMIGAARAKPFQGCFLIATCACNHDVFYLIEGAEAFEYCPGHREKKRIGKVSGEGDLIAVSSSEDSDPQFKIKLENGRYFLRYLNFEDDWSPVDQITSPWRTSFRSYFPE